MLAMLALAGGISKDARSSLNPRGRLGAIASVNPNSSARCLL